MLQRSTANCLLPTISRMGQRLNPFVKGTPGNQDPSLAAQTHQTDIYANPYDTPFIAAARVDFTHSDHIAHLNIRNHNHRL